MMNAEELSLVFIRLLNSPIMVRFKSWAVLEPVYLANIRVVFSPWCELLLMVLQCLELLDCLPLCSHALISSVFFIVLYTYFP